MPVMAVLVDNSVKIRSKEVNRNRLKYPNDFFFSLISFKSHDFDGNLTFVAKFGSWDYYRTFVTFQK